jgi:cytochrome P450
MSLLAIPGNASPEVTLCQYAGAMGPVRKIEWDRGAWPGDGCPVARDGGGVWQVTGYAAARALLRGGGTVQAGFNIEEVEKMPKRVRRPVLYRDGDEHREHRRQTARFFTPKRVDGAYRELMERVAGEQLDRLRRDGRADLSDLAFQLAVAIAAEVLGLTGGRPGLDRRLARMFPERYGKSGLTSLSGVYWLVRMNWWSLAFYVSDVRPAVRARRRRRADDVISHLIDEGCGNGEILGECLVFAPAGMVTTREFVVAAAWHLFTDAELLRRYRAGGPGERAAVLHEILRLEPVVATLRRTTTAPVTLPDGCPQHHGPVTIPAGARVDVAVTEANVDPAAVGADPGAIRPARPLGDGVAAAGLSFGDGAHKCPGAHVAIQETDIFLHRLFAMEGLRMERAPRVAFKPDIAAYELRGLTVAIR